MAHWIGLSLLCSLNERENPKSHMEIVQSNIYYYEKIKGYIVSRQELCLQKTYQDVPRKNEKLVTNHKILVHAQDFCACTTLLCMHNPVVHAQEVLCMYKNLVHAQES